MAKQFDDTNTFVLYKNDKGDNPKRPDSTGKINIDGVWYKLAAWTRESAKGKFLSGTAQPMEDKPKVVEQKSEDFSDEIPF